MRTSMLCANNHELIKLVQFICLRDQAIIYLSSKNLGGKGAAHEENLSDILFIWLEMKKTIRGRKHYWKPDSHGLITISSNKLRNPGGREAVNENKPVGYSLCGWAAPIGKAPVRHHLGESLWLSFGKHLLYDNLLANNQTSSLW